MKFAQAYGPYPLVAAPDYTRWTLVGIALLAVLGSANALLQPVIDPLQGAVGVGLVILLWILALLVRTLYYRFNRHNAQLYDELTAQLSQAWWTRHRQWVGLDEAVLLSPLGSTREHYCALFDSSSELLSSVPNCTGNVRRLLQVTGEASEERERQLAVLLAWHWRQRQVEPVVLQPALCYWHGSNSAWQAFVAEMTVQCPQVVLPDQPEPWRGLDCLDEIIDVLHDAPPASRILCAGCQSTPLEADAPRPPGEAALLWVLAPQGRARLGRGEWYCADNDDLAAVAERALQQSTLAHPAEHCLSLTQPGGPDLPLAWNARQQRLDAHLGDLGGLQTMVVQTLAAWQAEQQNAPCAWLASDPFHTLNLGILQADESSH